MSLADDMAIFVAIVEKGGFSHAATYLGLSNGLISRRIAKLEKDLGLSLLVRTTRNIKLTSEGELFLQRAKRIQAEMRSAIVLVKSLAKKPEGQINISAPKFFGKFVLMPIIAKFLKQHSHIVINLNLTNQQLDPIKENLDLIFRGAGYLHGEALKDSRLKMKLIMKQTIGLYATADYLQKNGTPKTVEALHEHFTIDLLDQTNHVSEWSFQKNKQRQTVKLNPVLNCNDIDALLTACKAGVGIGKFVKFAVADLVAKKQLISVLPHYHWGEFHVYAIFAEQQQLPARTRLLLDFIQSSLKEFN